MNKTGGRDSPFKMKVGGKEHEYLMQHYYNKSRSPSFKTDKVKILTEKHHESEFMVDDDVPRISHLTCKTEGLLTKPPINETKALSPNETTNNLEEKIADSASSPTPSVPKSAQNPSKVHIKKKQRGKKNRVDNIQTMKLMETEGSPNNSFRNTK